MVSIQLQDSVVAELTAQARRQGLSLEAFLSQIAAKDDVNGAGALTASELVRQLDELSFDVPPLPADFSRADIYLDHA
jgi:hypothetical protein